MRRKHSEILQLIAAGEYRRKPPSFAVPETDLPIREHVSPGTWFARDNVYNFIKFCRLLKVMDVVMFETEDLVSQKNEKHVILTLLEVARKGAKIGMLAPMLVQFEQEIDQELAREEKEMRRREREEQKERERQAREEEKRAAREEEKARKMREREEERLRKAEAEAKLKADTEAARKFQDEMNLASMAPNYDNDTSLSDVDDDIGGDGNDSDISDDDNEDIEEENKSG